MKKVAIFDIDGTVFRSSLFIRLVEALIDEDVFPKNMRSLYEREYHRWLNRMGTYDAYLDAVIDSFMRHIKGVSYERFNDVANRVVELEQHRIHRYTRDLVTQLKGDGYYLLAISQSPKTILETFCKGMGFDKVYGRFYETGPQSKFTGKVVDLHLIANKANIVKRAVKKENLTLKDSVGVGDSEGDIPFLELVDTPICFNPSEKLYKHAKRMGWKVVVERKDVIYEL